MKQLQDNIMQTVAEETVGLSLHCACVCTNLCFLLSLSVTTQSEENHVPSNSTLLQMIDNQTATKKRRGEEALKCEINVPRYPG